MYDTQRSLSAVKSISVEQKACYRNALLAFLSVDELHGGWYVEGFVVANVRGLSLPLEHGWVELPDGGIIDVTYAAAGLRTGAYFPAIRLKARAAMRLVETESPLPRMLLARSRRNRQAYLTAQAAAHRAAFGPDVLPMLESVAPPKLGE